MRSECATRSTASRCWLLRRQKIRTAASVCRNRLLGGSFEESSLLEPEERRPGELPVVLVRCQDWRLQIDSAVLLTSSLVQCSSSWDVRRGEPLVLAGCWLEITPSSWSHGPASSSTATCFLQVSKGEHLLARQKLQIPVIWS